MPHNNIVSADFELIIVKSKQTLWRKCVSLFSGSLLVFQSLAPGLAAIPQAFSPTAFAQEVTETPTETPTTTPETTPATTPESTPTEQPTVTPTEEVTPTPSVEVTPEATPTEELSPTPTETVSPSPTPTTNDQPSNNNGQPPQNNGPPAEQGQILDGVSTTATPTPTPVIVSSQAEEGDLQTVIIKNVEAESLDLDNVDPNNSATLTTDKADYAPTDTAVITGTNFAPNTAYTIVIVSNDPPPVHYETAVTSDENGSFVVAYQLDGTYRPNYSVHAYSNGEEVTSTTFTDAATGTLFPDGQGFYTSWTGDEDDVDETGSPDCEDNNTDGDDNVAESTTNDRESVLIDLSTIPNGSTITSVDVTVTYRNGNDGGADNGTFQTFTRLNGANLDSGVNLIATDTTCTSGTQTVNVADTVKNGATTLEIGVVKTGTDTSEVWVGTVRAVVTYTEAAPTATPTPTSTPTPTLTPTPVPLPDLVVVKTNNVPGGGIVGQEFTWTLTVSNIGTANATFNDQDILQDDFPSSGISFDDTSNLTVTNAGGTTGSVDCDISSNTLTCDDNSGGSTVVIPPGGSFTVNVGITPSSAGAFANPRSGGICQVDPANVITELIGGNNNCGDSVTVVTPTPTPSPSPTPTPSPTATPSPTPTPVANPSLPQSCGLDIAMVIDNSDSISTTELNSIKSAFNSFITALTGSPTQYSVTRFGTTASVVQTFTSSAATATAAVNGVSTGGGFTNWQDGLTKAQSTFNPTANPNLVLFASDGNPNRTGAAGTSATESVAVSDAQVVANALKAGGTRVVALGIGNDLDTANLQAISGPNVGTGLTSDVITSGFDTLAADLAAYASSLCGGKVIVTKLIDGQPQSGWTYTLGVTNGTSNPVSGATVANGTVQFDVTPTSGNATVNVTETVQAGYSVTSASCTNNNQPTGTFDNLDGVNGIVMDNNDIVACTFNNALNQTDLSLTKTDSADPINNGGALTYTITVNNLTAVPAANTVVTDNLPAGFAVTTVTPSQGTCPDQIAPDITCNLGTIAASGSATITVAGSVTTALTQISNTASVTTTTPETTTNNNSDTETTDINQNGSITVNKLVDRDGNGTFEDSNPVDFTWTLDGAGAYVMGSTNSTVPAGQRSVGENSPAGYHFVSWYPTGAVNGNQVPYSCDNPQSTTLPISVNVGAGGTSDYTLCNAVNTGTLIVQKTTLPGGDQTTFNINATGSGTITGGGAGVITDANDASYTVTPGTYAVTEDVPAGWTQVSNTCTGVVVAAGQTATCTITNGKLPTITVNKLVVNDNGGAKTGDQFTLRLNGNQVASGTATMVPPSSYTVSEDADSGYTGTVGGDCDANGGVTVAYGDNKICTITNNDLPATLIVKKIVVDSDASPSAFMFSINGNDGVAFEADGQNDFTVNAGVYTVTETPAAGFSTTYDNCTEVTVPNGGTATCTITNTRTNGRVVFSKIVVGGDASASAWTFTINGVTGTFQSGDAANIPTGTYTVTESGNVAGYTTTAVSGICSDLTQNNTATLTVTENGGTCTFTNTRDTGSVKVNKRTDNNGDGDYNDSGEGLNGTASNAFNWGLDGSGANVMGTTVANVNTGAHSVNENTVSGYHFVGWFPTSSTQYTCANPQNTTLPASVDVTTGQTTEITLCNARDTGTVRITKDAINNDSQNFTFNTTGGTLPSSFQLDDDSNGTLPNTRLFTVPTGQYTVTEATVSGWTLTNLVCTDDNGLVNLANRQATVNVSTGEQITCTFTNTELGSIEGVKYNDRDGDADHDFLEPRLNGWRIFIDQNDNGIYDSGEPTDTTSGSVLIFFPAGEYEFNNLLPGTYEVCEELQTGWYNSTPICQTVNVSAGENEDNIDFGNHEALTVRAYKVVCDNESYLPNWGDNDAPTITSNTAQNFVNNSEGHCHLQPDWDFQYGLDGQVSKETGGFIGAAGGNWQTLGTTNASGYAQATVTDLAGADGLWVRENLQANYVPFSYPPAGPTENDFSAELYCSNDGDHYDNFDQIEDPQFGNTYHCVAFNAPNNGDIEVTKYNDLDGDGEQDPGEPTLGGWTINLSGQQPQQTSANGTVSFDNLPIGTYALSETMQEGWRQTDISCSNDPEEEGPSGASGATGSSGATGVTGPTGSSGATGTEGEEETGGTCHWNEGSDQWNAIAVPITNPGHSDHVMDYVYGGPVDQNGHPDNQLGDAWCAQNVPVQTNTQQTFLGVPQVLAQRVDESDEENPTHPVTVGSGEHITCKIGNQFVNPDLTITKTNDAAGDKAPGQTVGFTLTVTAENGDVNDVTVTDLPSQGFTYQPGSWTANSDVRGDLKTSLVTTEPTYASPGDWNLGDMQDGETVTLTYTTNISNDQQSGLYHDLAWAAGDDQLSNEVVANDTTGVFVGTQVNVVRSTDGSAGINVIRDEKHEGSVLGASTELPATGASVFWLELAGLIFAAGIGSMIWGVSMSKKPKKSKRRLHA